MRLDKELAAGGYSILAPFRNKETTKHINDWVNRYAKEETKAYLTDIFIPYVKALPPEIRVKVFKLLIQADDEASAVQMAQVIEVLLVELEATGVDLDELRARLPAGTIDGA